MLKTILMIITVSVISMISFTSSISENINNLQIMSKDHEIVDGSQTHMPSSDQGAKIISLYLPSNIKFIPYTRPALTSDFRFGDYIPLCKYSIDTMTTSVIPVYTYTFLDNSITSLSVGNGLYTLVNIQYEYTNPVVDLLSGYNGGLGYPTKAIIEFFYKSRIVYISENAKNLINLSFFNNGIDKNGTRNWGIKIDIYEEKKKVHTDYFYEMNQSNEPDIFLDFDKFYNTLDLHNVITKTKNSSIETIVDYTKNKSFDIDFSNNEEIMHIPNDTNSILTLDQEHKILRIYSLDTLSLNYIIHLPNDVEINQYTSSNNLLITFFEHSNYYSTTYLFNLNDLSMIHLGEYMNNPLLSPDNSYVAYVKVHGQGSQEYATESNNLDEMNDGFYILNIRSNETTFYPVNDIQAYDYSIVCWVSRAGLNEIIDTSGNIK